MIVGLITIVFAGMLQGLFILPLTYTRNWKWEHYWLMFSLLGMIVLNWLLGYMLFPHAWSVLQNIPTRECWLLISMGLLWGVGAILFGLGMEKLGMSVGYPVIMGLIAGVGTILPLMGAPSSILMTAKGFSILTGCLLVIFGIVFCAKAGAARTAGSRVSTAPTQKQSIRSGIIIAVAAGILSALPNIGLSGVPQEIPGNLVWLLFFTFGFIANAAYTIRRIAKSHSFPAFFASLGAHNLGLAGLSAACWIGSFYLYGFSANRIGNLGPVVGWPLFISISIITGNLAGIAKGEWRHAPANAKRRLGYGIAFFIAALTIIGLGNR